MEFKPYKMNETMENLYFPLPKELFFNQNYKDKLSLEAKNLYAFMLDRLTLSIKNNWQDKDGNVYIIITREYVREILGISDKTVTKAFKELRECKLIDEKPQGRNKPKLIYVGKIIHDESIPNMTRKNYDSRTEKNTTHDTENLRGNYNNNNYNNRTNSFNNFEQRNYPEGALDCLIANNNWEAIYDN